MLIAIIGKPGTGKTTLVKKLLENISLDAGGFYTEEIRDDGVRVGFRIVDIASSKKATFAHVGIHSDKRVSKYGVDIEAFDNIAISSLENALDKDIVIIDEIGRMELFSEKFRTKLTEIVKHKDKKIIIVTMKKGARYFQLPKETIIIDLNKVDFEKALKQIACYF